MKLKQNYAVICTDRWYHSIFASSRQAFLALFIVFCLLFCVYPKLWAQTALRKSDVEAGGVRNGLDVLVALNFAPLRGKRIGLITNQTGLARNGKSGIDLLFQASKLRLSSEIKPKEADKEDQDTKPAGTGEAKQGEPGGEADSGPGTFQLVALFSPEHGLRGRAAAGATVGNSKDAGNRPAGLLAVRQNTEANCRHAS